MADIIDLTEDNIEEDTEICETGMKDEVEYITTYIKQIPILTITDNEVIHEGYVPIQQCDTDYLKCDSGNSVKDGSLTKEFNASSSSGSSLFDYLKKRINKEKITDKTSHYSKFHPECSTPNAETSFQNKTGKIIKNELREGITEPSHEVKKLKSETNTYSTSSQKLKPVEKEMNENIVEVSKDVKKFKSEPNACTVSNQNIKPTEKETKNESLIMKFNESLINESFLHDDLKETVKSEIFDETNPDFKNKTENIIKNEVKEIMEACQETEILKSETNTYITSSQNVKPIEKEINENIIEVSKEAKKCDIVTNISSTNCSSTELNKEVEDESITLVSPEAKKSIPGSQFCTNGQTRKQEREKTKNADNVNLKNEEKNNSKHNNKNKKSDNKDKYKNRKEKSGSSDKTKKEKNGNLDRNKKRNHSNRIKNEEKSDSLISNKNKEGIDSFIYYKNKNEKSSLQEVINKQMKEKSSRSINSNENHNITGSVHHEHTKDKFGNHFSNGNKVTVFTKVNNESLCNEGNTMPHLTKYRKGNDPNKNTFTDENNIVYYIPLLNLPAVKQVVQFSPEFLVQFLNKIRAVFNIERFLHITPNPLTFFTKQNYSQRRLNERCLSLVYLKCRYRLTYFADIEAAFNKNGYNLTLTCEELDKYIIQPRKKIRLSVTGCTCRVPHELTMTFIHEVTFIEHRSSIELYLKTKYRKDTAALDIEKMKGHAQTCGNCNIHFLGKDLIACSDGHVFCKNCLQRVIEARLQSQRNPFSCLEENCESKFMLEALKYAVPPVTFSSMLHFNQIQAMHLAGIRILETCPSCGFADIPADEERVFHCLNAECMKETCRFCKAPYFFSHKCPKLSIEGSLSATRITVLPLK